MYCKDCASRDECEAYDCYRELEQYFTPRQWERFEEVRLTMPCGEYVTTHADVDFDGEAVATRESGE